MHCPIHLGEEVKKAIEKKGAKLIYLSPYSPDFSPIENLWSKLKIILRSIKTANYQELGKAIEFALGSALHRQIFLIGLHTAVIVPHLFEKGYMSICYHARMLDFIIHLIPQVPNVLC